jgi:hypothetical protein
VNSLLKLIGPIFRCISINTINFSIFIYFVSSNKPSRYF